MVWLSKKGSGRAVVFFNGWGMDETAVAHLKGEADVLVVYDYRSLSESCPEALRHYRETAVIAWSMGVWAAANILPFWPIRPRHCIALNGTERPIDDRYGIPVRVYELTEKGMDARGREKFFHRMLSGPEERLRFAANRPARPLSEQCEELERIHRQSMEGRQGIPWTKAYISRQDVIFPEQNQQDWWRDKVPVLRLEGGHYPFYRFESWQEIIERTK